MHREMINDCIEMTHSHMVINEWKRVKRKEWKSAQHTRGTWKKYIDEEMKRMPVMDDGSFTLIPKHDNTFSSADDKDMLGMVNHQMRLKNVRYSVFRYVEGQYATYFIMLHGVFK